MALGEAFYSTRLSFHIRKLGRSHLPFLPPRAPGEMGQEAKRALGEAQDWGRETWV